VPGRLGPGGGGGGCEGYTPVDGRERIRRGEEMYLSVGL